MKKISIIVSLLALLIVTANAQNGTDLLKEFNRAEKSRPAVSWAGTWSRSSRFSPGTLKISAATKSTFKFYIEALNGANTGGVAGKVTVKGAKAFFDDKTNREIDDKPLGCKILFRNNGASIEIKESRECSGYSGNAVYLSGTYTKGKPVSTDNTFVELKVFPNIAIDRKFKLLVGAEYKNFLDDFQLVSEDTDADGFGAKVLSGCVRGICPYNTAIIMFDPSGKIWAAVMNLDIESQSRVYYFSNDPMWTAKLPKSIESWVEEKRPMNTNLTVIYKSKK